MYLSNKYIDKIIMSNHFINSFWDKMTQFLPESKKNFQLLEPLTTVIRLAALSFYPKGTKIAISNNKIFYQEPDALQGIYRWSYGYKRDELHQLFRPIVVCVQTYSNMDDASIIIIFKYAIKGLNLLKKSYDNISNIVCHSLDLYINVIKNAIGELSHPLNKPEIMDDELTNSIYEEFQNIWNQDQIDLIAKLLKEARNNKSETPYLLKAIHSIIEIKEKKVIIIVEKITSGIKN
tara:strand:+ start:716 stop:1420 length:705 start_codon:yes stop_codon:yes gene_type:complete